MFSRSCCRVCALYPRLSKKRPSLGLCLESLLGQSICVEGVEAGCMGGSLCSGGDVMNRSGDSCVYQWLCSDGSADAIARNAQIDIQER